MTSNVHRLADRKERRALLARPGVPIHRGTCYREVETLNGWRREYFWFATEDPNATPKEIMAMGIYGPYDSEAEALEAARIAIISSAPPGHEIVQSKSLDPKPH